MPLGASGVLVTTLQLLELEFWCKQCRPRSAELSCWHFNVYEQEQQHSKLCDFEKCLIS